MKELQIWPLTYFTPKTQNELDLAVINLQIALSKDYKNTDRLNNAVVNLFIDKFNPNNLKLRYKVELSDNLIKSVKKTLNYAIDTEIFIKYILSKLAEGE